MNNLKRVLKNGKYGWIALLAATLAFAASVTTTFDSAEDLNADMETFSDLGWETTETTTTQEYVVSPTPEELAANPEITVTCNESTKSTYQKTEYKCPKPLPNLPKKIEYKTTTTEIEQTSDGKCKTTVTNEITVLEHECKMPEPPQLRPAPVPGAVVRKEVIGH